MTTSTMDSPNGTGGPNSKRRPRFEREPKGDLILTDRDRELLQMIYDFRFCRAEHLAALTGMHEKALARRLTKFFHEGLVDRPPVQAYAQTADNAIVYAVSNKGTRELKASQQALFPTTDLSRQNREVKIDYFSHTLHLADLRVAVELACRHAGVKLIDYRQWDLRIPVKGPNTDGDKKESYVLKPDAFFIIETEHQELPFFCETDRATMPIFRSSPEQSSINKKLYGYYWLYQEYREAKQAGAPEAATIRKLFDIDTFRLLTLTNSPVRVNNMVECARLLPTAHRLFWFSELKHLSLENPLPFFNDPIWKSAKDDELQVLLQEPKAPLQK